MLVILHVFYIYTVSFIIRIGLLAASRFYRNSFRSNLMNYLIPKLNFFILGCRVIIRVNNNNNTKGEVPCCGMRPSLDDRMASLNKE